MHQQHAFPPPEGMLPTKRFIAGDRYDQTKQQWPLLPEVTAFFVDLVPVHVGGNVQLSAIGQRNSLGSIPLALCLKHR